MAYTREFANLIVSGLALLSRRRMTPRSAHSIVKKDKRRTTGRTCVVEAAPSLSRHEHSILPAARSHLHTSSRSQSVVFVALVATPAAAAMAATRSNGDNMAAKTAHHVLSRARLLAH